MSEDTSPDTAVIAAEPKPKAVKRSRAAATVTAPAAAPAKKTAVRKPRPAKSAEKKSEPPAESKAAAPSVSAPVEHVAEKPQTVVVQPAPAPVAPLVVAESAPPPVEARVIVEPAPAAATAPAPSAAPESSAPAPVAASPSSQPSVASENSTAAQLPSSEQRQPGDQQQRSGDQRDRGGDRRREGRHGRNRWRDRNRDRGNRDQQGQGDQQGDQQREPQSGDQQGAERPPERPMGPPEPADGILELSPKGYGFLRQRDRGYNQTPNDAFVSPEFIRKFGLREGMQIKGESRKGHRGPQVTEITEVNNRAPESMRDLPLFEELKAINPNKRIAFETVSSRLTTRVIDLVTPVGRGQRGLIVAPPRAGKTTLLQHVAEAVTQNHPQLHLMILLVDERPEEVTEFKKLLPRAEIFASSNDMDVKSHTRICQFAIERAKRLCECGEHVFILLDSITRMARAFNNSKSGGATMSGGVGVGALEIPRRLFAAARNTRGAGSITILATALVETGSRMDDLIFQEFKGTGNMELVLDRKIAEQYTFPAVNVLKSGTRREELLIPAFQLEKIHMLRRGLGGHKPIEAIQRVISLLERYPNNNQMLVELPSKQF